MKCIFDTEFTDDSKVIPQIYGEADVTQAREEGYQLGVAKGLLSAENGIMARIQDLLPTLQSSILTWKSQEEQERTQIFRDCLDFATAVSLKIAREEAQKNAINQVMATLKEALAFLENPYRLVLDVHPSLVDQMTELTKAIPGYDPQVWTIAGNESLEILDCILKWENGEIQHNMTKICDQIKIIGKATETDTHSIKEDIK